MLYRSDASDGSRHADRGCCGPPFKHYVTSAFAVDYCRLGAGQSAGKVDDSCGSCSYGADLRMLYGCASGIDFAGRHLYSGDQSGGYFRIAVCSSALDHITGLKGLPTGDYALAVFSTDGTAGDTYTLSINSTNPPGTLTGRE